VGKRQGQYDLSRSSRRNFRPPKKVLHYQQLFFKIMPTILEQLTLGLITGATR
jgi:hypothetical protein